jgi:uncharacterized protein YdeI (YjbR/CyaY-like superfamily)
MKLIELKLDFDTINQWQAWLDENHLEDFVVWLRIKKIKSLKSGIHLKDAVHEMLKYGWIDGKVHPIDQDYFIIRCTKRKPNSVWSMINRMKVEEFIESNEMHKQGLEMVNYAKLTGAWDAAYSSKEPIIIPSDIDEELNRNIRAKETFDQYSSSDKMQLIFWINQAKRPETRIKRINRLIQLASEGKRITQL